VTESKKTWKFPLLLKDMLKLKELLIMKNLPVKLMVKLLGLNKPYTHYLLKLEHLNLKLVPLTTELKLLLKPLRCTIPELLPELPNVLNLKLLGKTIPLTSKPNYKPVLLSTIS